MEPVKKSIQAKVMDEITWLALKRTGILTSELRGLCYDRAKQQVVYADQSSQLSTSVDLLILGKEHYREENRSFPLQSRRELSKILALESAANDADTLFYKIGDYIDGERLVVIWSCAKEIFSRWNIKPLLVVPESLLLLASSPDQLVTLKREGQAFWFYNRQGKYLSAAKKGLIANTQMFKASAGLAADIDQREVTDEDYLSVLTSALTPVVATHLLGLKTSLRQLQTVDWRNYAKYCGLAAAVLLTGYFSLTSMYLKLRLESAVSTSQALSDKTESVFMLKKQLTQIEQRQQQLSEVSSIAGAPSVIWRLISPLMQREVTIKQLGYLPDGRVLMMGTANKDTEVLAFLNDDEMVEAPKLNAGTRTVKGKDHFNIVFKIRESK
ncbi:MAG: hypothetical protein ACI8WB_002036 [Phenylobacterium sp.]|jgi:hypothetical protein